MPALWRSRAVAAARPGLRHSLHRRCAIEGIGRVAGSGIGIEDLEGCSLQGTEIRTERAVFSRSQYSALVQGQYYTFSSPSRRSRVVGRYYALTLFSGSSDPACGFALLHS